MRLTSGESACDSLSTTTTTTTTTTMTWPERVGVRSSGSSSSSSAVRLSMSTHRGASKRELAAASVEVMEIAPLGDLDGGERVHVAED